MARPFRQQIDESILDRAAALFARRGFAKTSVQDIADAVGLSKAGLLHHFPTKDALHEAVLAQADAVAQRVLDEVRAMPLGTERDRRAVDAVVDAALAHPGLVALLLAPAVQADASVGGDGGAPGVALEAFGVDPATAEPERLVRVLGALGALAVLTLAAHQGNTTTAWRVHVAATCFDALGHRRPGSAPPGSDPLSSDPLSSDQVEA